MKLGHMLPSELESRLRQPFSPPTFAQIPAARPLFSLNLNKIQTNNNTMHNINTSILKFYLFPINTIKIIHSFNWSISICVIYAFSRSISITTF